MKDERYNVAGQAGCRGGATMLPSSSQAKLTTGKMRERQRHQIVLVAACALVDADHRVLLTRRPEGKPMAGLWEFPGGKVRKGETPEACVIRELEEELGLDTAENCLAPLTFASHAYPDFHLLMPVFVCRVWHGFPQAREGQAIRWFRPGDMAGLPMPPADLPLVAFLRDYL
jgi:8-oxo-dGTP diphosphatase